MKMELAPDFDSECPVQPGDVVEGPTGYRHRVYDVRVVGYRMSDGNVEWEWEYQSFRPSADGGWYPFTDNCRVFIDVDGARYE